MGSHAELLRAVRGQGDARLFPEGALHAHDQFAGVTVTDSFLGLLEAELRIMADRVQRACCAG